MTAALFFAPLLPPDASPPRQAQGAGAPELAGLFALLLAGAQPPQVEIATGARPAPASDQTSTPTAALFALPADAFSQSTAAQAADQPTAPANPSAAPPDMAAMVQGMPALPVPAASPVLGGDHDDSAPAPQAAPDRPPAPAPRAQPTRPAPDALLRRAEPAGEPAPDEDLAPPRTEIAQLPRPPVSASEDPMRPAAPARQAALAPATAAQAAAVWSPRAATPRPITTPEPQAPAPAASAAPAPSDPVQPRRSIPAVVAATSEAAPEQAAAREQGGPEPANDAFEGSFGRAEQSAPEPIRPAPSVRTAPPAPMVQIGIQIARAAPARIDRLFVQLEPAALGRVEVRLDFHGDNQVSAIIAADRPDTLDALQRDARLLERSLHQAGLHLDSDGLTFSLKREQPDGHARDHAPTIVAEDAAEPSRPPSPADPPPVRWFSGLRTLDIRI